MMTIQKTRQMKPQTNALRQISRPLHTYRNLAYLTPIVLLGAALRIYDLGTESFWTDEIFTVYLVRQDLRSLIPQLIFQGRSTRDAVYFLLAHFWIMPFEVNELSIRSLSVVSGVLSIGMMYLVGKQLFGAKIGLLSSFLIAVSVFQIQHSQAARFYSLFVFLTLCSLYSYVLALRSRKPYLWIVNLLINILLFYTHSYAVFVFAAQDIHFFIYWKRDINILVPWGFSQVLLLLSIAPSVLPMIAGGSLAAGLGGSLAWISTPSAMDLLRTVYGYLFPQNYQHSWIFIGASFAAAFLFWVAVTLVYNSRKVQIQSLELSSRRFRDSFSLDHIDSESILVVLWFVCPVLLPFVYSIFINPIFSSRYTICAAPAFYLMVAKAISKIRRNVPVYVSLGALMIVVLPGIQDYYASPTNDQWREAAIYVQEYARANDIIAFAPDEEGYQHKSFDWYSERHLPYCSISQFTIDKQTFASNLSNCTLGHERFWVAQQGAPEVVDRFKAFLATSNQPGVYLIQERQFVGISVYLFGLKR